MDFREREGKSAHDQAGPAGNGRVPAQATANPHPLAGQARCRRDHARWNTAATSTTPKASATGRFFSDSGTSGKGTLAATLAPVAVTGARVLALKALRSARPPRLRRPRMTKMRS